MDKICQVPVDMINQIEINNKLFFFFGTHILLIVFKYIYSTTLLYLLHVSLL